MIAHQPTRDSRDLEIQQFSISPNNTLDRPMHSSYPNPRLRINHPQDQGYPNPPLRINHPLDQGLDSMTCTPSDHHNLVS